MILDHGCHNIDDQDASCSCFWASGSSSLDEESLSHVTGSLDLIKKDQQPDLFLRVVLTLVTVAPQTGMTSLVPNGYWSCSVITRFIFQSDAMKLLGRLVLANSSWNIYFETLVLPLSFPCQNFT